MTLDAKLKWKEHIKKKKKQCEQKYKSMYYLLGRNSNLSIYNKILIYNQIIKPIWAYGIQLWGCAPQTHINSIQTFQNKVLRNIVGAPWYIRNSDIHRDLAIPTINTQAKMRATSHQTRLSTHINVEVSCLFNDQNHFRRLKRVRPIDLC
jgi:hypothetical protein